VLKMRGSSHDRDIREFVIDSQGMHIGAPFRSLGGILTGRIFTATDPLAAPTDLPN
jgi:circadian clock protein KaiC